MTTDSHSCSYYSYYTQQYMDNRSVVRDAKPNNEHQEMTIERHASVAMSSEGKLKTKDGGGRE